nr:glutathione S-transferase [Aureimonas sp. AU4]
MEIGAGRAQQVGCRDAIRAIVARTRKNGDATTANAIAQVSRDRLGGPRHENVYRNAHANGIPIRDRHRARPDESQRIVNVVRIAHFLT